MLQKGCCAIGIMLCLCWMPLQAAESSDEIVVMMQWWEKYGRFLEEVDVASPLDSEVLFAQLDEDHAYSPHEEGK